MDKNYCVVARTTYSTKTVYNGALAGLGRNKGTWDISHSKRTAQRHAKRLREEHKPSEELLTGFMINTTYTVERSF